MTDKPTEHPFAPFVRILGKGKTGSRSLSQSEARDALGMILRGETEAVQVGAFLMLLRVKEETAEEMAPFRHREYTEAAPRQTPAQLSGDCDGGPCELRAVPLPSVPPPPVPEPDAAAPTATAPVTSEGAPTGSTPTTATPVSPTTTAAPTSSSSP